MVSTVATADDVNRFVTIAVIQCVRYLEFIEGQPPKGCSLLLIQALLYTCYVSMGLEMKASRRMETLREAFNVEYTAGRM